VTLERRLTRPDIIFAAAGGLMSYGNSNTDAYRQVGVYTRPALQSGAVATDRESGTPSIPPEVFKPVRRNRFSW
jgi:hypothetical protein